MSGDAGRDHQGLQLASLAPIGPGLTPPSPGAMLTELESMRGFKKRVDELLTELGDSEAEPVRMADDRLPSTTLGANFSEATGLHSAYTQVHEQLGSLSRILSGQISALSTAIEGARQGYENVDYAARDAMWAIQSDSEAAYDPALDPYADTQPTGAGSSPDKGGDEGSGDGPGKKGAEL